MIESCKKEAKKVMWASEMLSKKKIFRMSKSRVKKSKVRIFRNVRQ